MRYAEIRRRRWLIERKGKKGSTTKHRVDFSTKLVNHLQIDERKSWTLWFRSEIFIPECSADRGRACWWLFVCDNCCDWFETTVKWRKIRNLKLFPMRNSKNDFNRWNVSVTSAAAFGCKVTGTRFWSGYVSLKTDRARDNVASRDNITTKQEFVKIAGFILLSKICFYLQMLCSKWETTWKGTTLTAKESVSLQEDIQNLGNKKRAGLIP